jgi:large subunit ribosomal protein L25
MPEIISLTAEPRPQAGKGAARATRRSGRVPGIVYGGAEAPMQISLEPRELSRAISRAGFFATVVDLSIDGAKHRTLARDIQYHPVSDAALHVDFMRVTAGAQVRVSVPVGFVNQDRSPGLRRGGILNIIRHAIDIACSVDAIPDRLVVDLDGLEIGDSVHIDTIQMPEGVRPILRSRDSTIASIAASSAVREEALAAAAATTGPAEEGAEAGPAATPEA